MKRGRRRRVNRALTFPSDGLVEVADVGEDGVSGSTDVCGNCGESRGCHMDGVGACSMNDCRRFREI